MKRYRGIRTEHGVVVTVDGVPLNPRFDLWNHSPDGFEWGYGGSSPTQLALALLMDVFGDEQVALEWHYDFKAAVIAGLSLGGWTLTEEEIRDTITAFANA